MTKLEQCVLVMKALDRDGRIELSVTMDGRGFSARAVFNDFKLCESGLTIEEAAAKLHVSLGKIVSQRRETLAKFEVER